MPVDMGVGLLLLCVILLALIAILGAVFWVWMLVDCLTNESSEGNDKIVWMLVIFFLHLLGASLYFFIRRGQRMRELGR